MTLLTCHLKILKSWLNDHHFCILRGLIDPIAVKNSINIHLKDFVQENR